MKVFQKKIQKSYKNSLTSFIKSDIRINTTVHYG